MTRDEILEELEEACTMIAFTNEAMQSIYKVGRSDKYVHDGLFSMLHAIRCKVHGAMYYLELLGNPPVTDGQNGDEHSGLTGLEGFAEKVQNCPTPATSAAPQPDFACLKCSRRKE